MPLKTYNYIYRIYHTWSSPRDHDHIAALQMLIHSAVHHRPLHCIHESPCIDQLVEIIMFYCHAAAEQKVHLFSCVMHTVH